MSWFLGTKFNKTIPLCLNLVSEADKKQTQLFFAPPGSARFLDYSFPLKSEVSGPGRVSYIAINDKTVSCFIMVNKVGTTPLNGCIATSPLTLRFRPRKAVHVLDIELSDLVAIRNSNDGYGEQLQQHA